MSKKTENNVYTGPDALAEFLNPQTSYSTPLVELSKKLNTFSSDNVRIFAKAVFLSPLFNIKHFPAFNLLQAAKDKGELEGVHTLVENSSGNMAFSLAVLARFFGISRVIAIVPRDIPSGKIDLLRLFGVDIEFNSESPGGRSGIARAHELGQQEGWFNLGQYDNESNPNAYEKYLAPEIWEQTNEALTLFCTGLGSTGTLLGSARYFKKQSNIISIIGVAPQTDTVPGVRSMRRLKEIAFDWGDVLDHHVEVDSKESFKKSLELCRAGLLAGPSSGMALLGLMQVLEKHKSEGTLDQLRNKDGEVVAVFVCPDSALLYLEKYPANLDPEDFNLHLESVDNDSDDKN